MAYDLRAPPSAPEGFYDHIPFPHPTEACRAGRRIQEQAHILIAKNKARNGPKKEKSSMYEVRILNHLNPRIFTQS